MLFSLWRLEDGSRRSICLYEAKLTPVLVEPAKTVGVYKYLWEPSETKVLIGSDLRAILSKVLPKSKDFPELFAFLTELIDACSFFPFGYIYVESEWWESL